jgi:hypothetical protein
MIGRLWDVRPLRVNGARDHSRRAGSYVVTKHAASRMAGRHIPLAAIDAARQFGRRFYIRGAVVWALGRKEIEHLGRQFERLQGIQVVCSHDGAVLTVYKNTDLRGLRRRRRRRGKERFFDHYPGARLRPHIEAPQKGGRENHGNTRRVAYGKSSPDEARR